MASHREIDRDPWALYQPSPEAPWNRRRVVHLHRRAAFAATVDELERDLKDGPGPSIDRLLNGRVSGSPTIPGFDQTIETITNAAVESHQPDAFKRPGCCVCSRLRPAARTIGLDVAQPFRDRKPESPGPGRHAPPE